MNTEQPVKTSRHQKSILLILLLLFVSSVTVLLFAFPEETPIVNIILETTELSVGDQGTLGISTNQEDLEWSSLNTSIVTVDGNGLIRGVSAGSSEITVKTPSGESDSITVTVKALEDDSFTITIGDEVFNYLSTVNVSDLEIPSKENFVFNGWFLDEDLSVPLTSSTISSDTILYPKYDAIDIAPETITLTLLNEEGVVINTYEVVKGEAFDFDSLTVNQDFVGFYENPETCDSIMFDTENLLIEDTTLTLVYNDDSAPCIKLDEIDVKGTLELGEVLEVFYTPISEDVTFTWYRLENGIYEVIPNATRKFYTITENDLETSLKVEVTASGEINGTVSYITEPINSEPIVMVDYDTIYETICDGNMTLDMIYPVGSGTQSNPYLITNWYQLDLLRYAYHIAGDTASHFRISQDLNNATLGYQAVASPATDFNTGFTPIMNEPCSEDPATSFVGIVYADNVTISDVYINLPGDDYVGLFGEIDSNSQLIGFTLDNFNVTGNDFVGALVGEMVDSIVDDVTVTNTVVNGTERIGGIIGRLDGSSVSNSSFDGSVYGQLYVGGIAGSSYTDDNDPNNGSLISNSQNDGNIYGQMVVGGIVGGNGLYATVQDVINTGLISFNLDYFNEDNNLGNDSNFLQDLFLSDYGYEDEPFYGSQFGGLIGGNSGSLIDGASSGDVLINVPAEKIGGAIGAIGVGGSATNVIVQANVSGAMFVAGLVGFLGGPLSDATYLGSVYGSYDANGVASIMINDSNYSAEIQRVAVLINSSITSMRIANGFGFYSFNYNPISITNVSIHADIVSTLGNATGFIPLMNSIVASNVILQGTLNSAIEEADTYLIGYELDSGQLDNIVLTFNGSWANIDYLIEDLVNSSTANTIYLDESITGLDSSNLSPVYIEIYTDGDSQSPINFYNLFGVDESGNDLDDLFWSNYLEDFKYKLAPLSPM